MVATYSDRPGTSFNDGATRLTKWSHPSASITSGTSAARFGRRIQQLIHATFERVVNGQSLRVGEREKLHHHHAPDAQNLNDPKGRIADSTPAHAATAP